MSKFLKFSGFFLITLSFVFISCFDDADLVAKSEIFPAYTITASQLYTEYSESKKAADNKYKKKWIVLSGEVVNTYNALNIKNITLGAGNTGLTIIEVYMRDADEFASVKVGQHVTVIGRYDGVGPSFGLEINGAFIKE